MYVSGFVRCVDDVQRVRARMAVIFYNETFVTFDLYFFSVKGGWF